MNYWHAAALVHDPSCDAPTLALIAAEHPSLRAEVARHPNGASLLDSMGSDPLAATSSDPRPSSSSHTAAGNGPAIASPMAAADGPDGSVGTGEPHSTDAADQPDEPGPPRPAKRWPWLLAGGGAVTAVIAAIAITIATTGDAEVVIDGTLHQVIDYTMAPELGTVITAADILHLRHPGYAGDLYLTTVGTRDDRAFFVASTGRNAFSATNTLAAVAIPSGAVLWSVNTTGYGCWDMPAIERIACQSTQSPGMVFYDAVTGDSRGTLVAPIGFDDATGSYVTSADLAGSHAAATGATIGFHDGSQEKWSVELDSFAPSRAQVLPDTVAVSGTMLDTQTWTTIVLDAGDGTELFRHDDAYWATGLGDDILLRGLDGPVAVYTRDGRELGTMEWSANYYTALSRPDHFTYLSAIGTVIAYAPGDYEHPQWESATLIGSYGCVPSPGCVIEQREAAILLVGRDQLDGFVTALDADTGALAWQAPLSSPIAATDTGRIFAAHDGAIVALSATDGTLEWEAPMGDVPDTSLGVAGRHLMLATKDSVTVLTP